MAKRTRFPGGMSRVCITSMVNTPMWSLSSQQSVRISRGGRMSLAKSFMQSRFRKQFVLVLLALIATCLLTGTVAQAQVGKRE